MSDLAGKYPLTEEGLSEALKALGETPDQVAGALDKLGLRGHRGDCHSCPVAVYVLEIYPECSVTVSEHYVIVTGPSASADVDMNEPVSAFITAFDGEAYPALEVVHA